MLRWLRSLMAREEAASGERFVEQPPPEFSSATPPDWMLVMHFHVLPGGGSFCVCVSLFSNRLGEAGVTADSNRLDRYPPCVGLSLSRAEDQRLSSILQEGFPHRFHDEQARCRDGLPCKLTVYRRRPFEGRRASCNLGDWFVYRAEEAAFPLVARLGVLLLDLYNRAYRET